MKSPRHEIADRLAALLHEEGMCRPFGGDVTKATDERTYDVLFAMPVVLDGIVRVFSPGFILIIMAGRACPDGSGTWREVYTSEDDAAAFLRAVGRGDHASAVAVQTREQKRNKERNKITQVSP